MPTDFSSKANEPVDYYELLQVSPKADPEIIEAAYRRLALKYHPDQNNTPEATGRMQALNEAYTILKDPTRRAEYDRERGGQRRREAGPEVGEESEFTHEYPDFSALYEDDYQPPPRDFRYWKTRTRVGLARAGLFTRLGWVGAGLMVVVVALVLALQNPSGATNDPPSATEASLPPVLPQAALFFDNFDNGGGANWKFETPWHVTARYSVSGKNSLWFGEEGNGRYRSNLNIAATLTRPLDLSDTSRPVLYFRLSGQSDHEINPVGEDRLFVEVAEPGRDFQTVFSANGLYANWQDISVDLGRWKGKSVVLRFRFTSGTLNSGAGFSGFFIDDVRVEKGS